MAATLVAGAALAAGTAAQHAAVAAVVAAAFAAARLPSRLVWQGLRGVVWLVLFVVAANLGFELLARRVPAAAAFEGAATSWALVLLVVRLVELVLLALVFTATTVPVDAAEAVERLLRPLGRVGLPVHEIGPLLVLSLGFVPLFAREARALADAHRLKIGRARLSLRDRASALAPLVVPLFLGVVRRADDLAVALDARCFVPGAPRTSLEPGRFGRPEWIAIGASTSLALGVAFAALRRA